MFLFFPSELQSGVGCRPARYAQGRDGQSESLFVLCNNFLCSGQTFSEFCSHTALAEWWLGVGIEAALGKAVPREHTRQQRQTGANHSGKRRGPLGSEGASRMLQVWKPSGSGLVFLQNESRWDWFYFICLLLDNRVVKSRGSLRELEAVDSINTFKREKKWGFCTYFLDSLFFFFELPQHLLIWGSFYIPGD